MALKFDNYSISSIDSITAFDIATGECRFILDELKSATLSGDAELVWATGREGRKLSSLKRNKTCKIEAQNGFIVGGLLAETFGDKSPQEDFTNKTIPIPSFERISVDPTGSVAYTEFEAVGTLGNEIEFIYKANEDGTQGTKYVQGATADASTFTYDPTTKEITLPVGIFENGDKIIVFYDYLTIGRKYINKSDTYAGDVKLVCDIMVKSACGTKERHSKLVMPRVSISDTFSYSFGGDMAVQDFSAEAISSYCGGSKDKEYFYWVFPE